MKLKDMSMRNIIMLAVAAIIVLSIIACVVMSALSSRKPDPIDTENVSSYTPPLQVDTETTGVSSIDVAQEEISFFSQSEGKLTLETPFSLPGTGALSADSLVTLGKKLKITTNKNWLSRLDGNKLDMVHTNGAMFSISRGAFTSEFTMAAVNTYMQDTLTNMGATVATINDIFSKDKVIGRLSSADLIIDNKTYTINLIIFMLDKEIFQGLCLYDASAEESIDNLYKSIYNGEIPLKLR